MTDDYDTLKEKAEIDNRAQALIRQWLEDCDDDTNIVIRQAARIVAGYEIKYQKCVDKNAVQG